MSRIKIILIVVLLITLFLVGLFFFLFGVNIPYKLRFNKDNPDYRLEKIDINEHRTQSYDLIYSLTTSELKELINTSDSIYQLVYIYNLTCLSVTNIANILKDSLFVLERTEVFPVSVSDRTLCPMFQTFLNNIPTKRYVIDSELYYSYFFDMYEHNNIAKMNFLQDIKKDVFYEGTYVILFRGWDDILLYNDDKYNQKFWKEGMSYKELVSKFVSTITADVKKFTQNTEPN
jgi:lipopolysaccharide export system protein LptC